MHRVILIAVVVVVVVVVVFVIVRVVVPRVQRATKTWKDANDREQERKLRRQIEALPLKITTPSADNKLTDVRVWPTTGDQIPRSVLVALEEYIGNIRISEIHRRRELEYRSGKWGEAAPRGNHDEDRQARSSN